MWLAGYGGREERSCGASEPIIAGVLAVQAGAQTPALVVTLDVVGVPDTPSRDLRRRIAAATGVPEAAILIACSHTHFAPSPWLQRLANPALGLNEPDPAYREELFAAVVACAKQRVLVNFACHPVTGDPSRRPPVASWSASGRAWRAGGSSGPRNDRAG